MTDNTLSRLREWGDGFFTTIRFHNGQFLNLHYHLKRLVDSAVLFNMEFDVSPATFLKSIEKELPVTDGLLRLECSASADNDQLRTVLFAFSIRSLPALTDDQVQNGVELTVSSLDYTPPFKAIQSVKLLAWQPWALIRANNPGGFDTLVSDGTRIFEGTRTALIGKKDGRWYSNRNSETCLRSTTVDLFADFLIDEGTRLEDSEFLIGSIGDWDALFILNAGIGCLPVSSFTIPGMLPIRLPVEPDVGQRFNDYYLQS